jgi:hypothetical protein
MQASGVFKALGLCEFLVCGQINVTFLVEHLSFESVTGTSFIPVICFLECEQRGVNFSLILFLSQVLLNVSHILELSAFLLQTQGGNTFTLQLLL